MYENTLTANLSSIIKQSPHAVSQINGRDEYPDIYGKVRLYQTNLGVLVCAEIIGLPSPSEKCKNPIFGFHIHGGSSCNESENDPFPSAMAHYDTQNCPHPYHAGDLPPLFGNNGYAFLAFITNRFSVGEVIGKTFIIHSAPDDFTTQPAGNSGERIACGIIQKA